MPDLDPSLEYQSIRAEIRHEHSLIANRLSWFVTSQSFLVTAFAISRGSGFMWFHWFSTVLLPAVGVASSALIFPSIVGACRTIDLWHLKEVEFFDRQPEYKMAFTLPRPSWIERRGLLFPMVMPVLFGLLWLVIVVAGPRWHVKL